MTPTQQEAIDKAVQLLEEAGIKDFQIIQTIGAPKKPV